MRKILLKLLLIRTVAFEEKFNPTLVMKVSSKHLFFALPYLKNYFNKMNMFIKV